MPGPVQSIERAAAILHLLARGRAGLGLVEIANSLGLAKGTAHGILRTLHDVGFVEQDRATGKYHIGATLLDLGARRLDANELRSRAINWSDALASRSGEAVRIGTLAEGAVRVVHHVFRPDDTAQALDVGSMLPLHASALGKVLLAYDPSATAALTGGRLDRFTQRTIVSPRELAGALAEVRAAGWAPEVEELAPGAAGIAAPIRDRGGLVVGAVGISGAVDRICDARMRPRSTLAGQVRSAARAISRELGAPRR